jgi:hypothetical protein
MVLVPVTVSIVVGNVLENICTNSLMQGGGKVNAPIQIRVARITRATKSVVTIRYGSGAASARRVAVLFAVAEDPIVAKGVVGNPFAPLIVSAEVVGAIDIVVAVSVYLAAAKNRHVLTLETITRVACTRVVVVALIVADAATLYGNADAYEPNAGVQRAGVAILAKRIARPPAATRDLVVVAERARSANVHGANVVVVAFHVAQAGLILARTGHSQGEQQEVGEVD